MLILLDNGHGIDTKGKRSPLWKNGQQLFEFEFNRDIVRRISLFLEEKEIPHVVLVPEITDISLEERCIRANQYPFSLTISIHANAGGGTGFEVFTSKGKTASDRFASIIGMELQREFPEFAMRQDYSDGDLDKEENFYILKNTKYSTVLTENLFMDTWKDCELLMSEEGRQRIANAHSRAIYQICRFSNG